MEKLCNNLSSRKSLTEAYDFTLEESKRPLKSTFQSQQPRDKKDKFKTVKFW